MGVSLELIGCQSIHINEKLQKVVPSFTWYHVFIVSHPNMCTYTSRKHTK